MEEKFTYYININLEGYVQLTNFVNKLSLVKSIKNEHEGFCVNELMGSFIVFKSDFDNLYNAFDNNYIVKMQIYENGTNLTGTKVWEGFINEFNDFDFNNKSLECKDFQTDDEYTEFIRLLNSNIGRPLISGAVTVNPYTLKDAVNNYTYTLISTKFKESIKVLIPGYDFDINDCWYNNASIDLSKLRITDSIYLAYITPPDVLPPDNSITLREMLNFMEVMFRAYAYIDNGYLKFKLPEDFCNNILDLSSEMENLQSKSFVNDFKTKQEFIKYNVNNRNAGYYYIVIPFELFDEDKASIVYSYDSTKTITYDLSRFFSTYDQTANEIDRSGFWIAMANSSNEIEFYTPPGEATSYPNGRLFPASIITNYYRDYIHTTKINYTYYEVQETVRPTHYKPFIEFPNISLILNSIANFYDGIVYKKDESDNRIIGRVWEQKTDLNTNITTFKTYEFINEIN